MKYKISEPIIKDNLQSVIPKGYRLIKEWELLKMSYEDKKIKELLIADYVWCEHFGQAVVFGLYYVNFYIDAYYVIYYGRPARGVFVNNEVN